MLDCHNERTRKKLTHLMEKRETNIYTIEKGGIKKLIYQTPWYEEGQYRGFLELQLEIPLGMSHFARDS
jgi:hypothetical protein